MRMDFKTFLVEAKSVQQSTEQRTHSEHVNHLPFDGHEAMSQVHDTMTRMNNYLLGRKNSIPKLVSTKIDGAPAIHFLKDENGRIGIATKGVFNKNPKIAWTHEDVSNHYGHAPGLEQVMHTMLDHGHKILPADMKPGEMYKGDVLKKAGNSDGHSVLHSNLLRYKFPKGSSESDQIDKAKVGVALHTHYDRKGRASAISPQQRAKFRSHPDVFNMNPDVQVNPENYTPDEQREFNTHMENARTEYQRLKPEAYDAVGHHNMDMRSYANDVVRKGTKEPLTTEGYIDFLTNKHKKDLTKYKTQGSIDKKSQAHSDKVNEIMRNKEHFDKLFKIHDHIQKAKDVLIGVMDKNNPSHVELPNGQPTRHEGYMTDGGIKFVDQDNFSKNNFAFGAMQQAKKGEVNEAVKLPENAHVTFIGRTQPPHGGHLHAVQGVVDHANKTGATHSILLTHTHDKNNPLTPEQKLKYAQKSFPGANIQMTSKEAPSVLHHASQLHSQGIRNFTLFAGPERLPSYEKLLNSYNGVKGPHGYYKFDNINLMSSGDRDPDAEGVEGASGTAMKKAAMAGDTETFHAMASPHLSPADKTSMMKDVQAGLAKFAKPKKIKEEFTGTVAGGEMVRGFGDVSGNPAVQDNPLQQYIGANALAKDQQNGALMKMMKDSKHDTLSFKAFDPKEFEKIKRKK